MDRRAALAALCAAAFAPAAFGQPKQGRRRLAIFGSPHDSWDDPEWHARLVKALAAHGYSDGENLEVLVFRRKIGASDRGAFIAAMVRAAPDCILSGGSVDTIAVHRATSRIPIVTVVADPVAVGLAKTVARPGGNVTGLYGAAEDVFAKEIEFLRRLSRASPTVGWIAFERQLAWYPAFERAAARLGVEALKVALPGNDRWTGVVAREFEALRAKGCTMAHFWSGVPDLIARVASLALRHRVAIAYNGPEASMERDGLLLRYASADGPGEEDEARLAAMVARIFRGARPAEMPFEGPTRFSLVINARTARLLRLEIPRDLLVLADRVIR